MKKHKTSKPKHKKTAKHTKAKKVIKPVKTKEKAPAVIKIAVIGAGPIGSILGAYLARTHHQVTMVDVLKERLETIRKLGIAIAGVVNFQTPVHDVTHKISDLKKSNLDYIFICVKASALPAILRQVKSAMSKNTIVICFQNGLDVEETAADALGKNRVTRAVINYAGNILSEGQILMSFFNAPNYIGGLSAESNLLAEKVAKLLTDTGLTTKFSTEIKKYTWEKTVLNSALAPVCGLTRLKMNEAMALPQTRMLAQEILKEGIAVAKANGYDLGKKFYSEGLEYLNKTGAHKPSMLIDIEARNATEIGYMNGKILEYAQAKNVPTPYNETLTTLVRGLEKSFLTAESVKKEKAAEAKTEEAAASPAVRPGTIPPVKWGGTKPQGETTQSSFSRSTYAYEMPVKKKYPSPAPATKGSPVKGAAKKAHAKPAKKTPPSRARLAPRGGGKAAKKKKALARA